MSPARIKELLEGWREAERHRDDGPQSGGAYIEANEAVERARRAYLEAVTARATEYGYAGGQRTVHADIEHMREAEDRRMAAEPSSPDYHDAAKDVQDRALRILTQVIEDEVAAQRQRESKPQT